jgi:3'(2'), 5'-bisphosphate nucleotidase
MSDETQQFIEAIETDKTKELVSIGSSLKICLIAEGEADVYPRIAPTMEWDTAAAHAVVLESGMNMCRYEAGVVSNQLAYNKQNLLNPFFVVSTFPD